MTNEVVGLASPRRLSLLQRPEHRQGAEAGQFADGVNGIDYRISLTRSPAMKIGCVARLTAC